MKLRLAAAILLLSSGISSAAFDCEDEAVTEAVKTKVICEAIFQPCSYFGLPDDYQQIQRLSRASIIEKYNRTYAAQVARESSTLQPSYRQATEKIVELGRDAVLSLQGLLTKERSIAEDYNPRIARYTCRFQFEYEPEKLKSLLLFMLTRSSLKRIDAQALLSSDKGYDAFARAIALIWMEHNADQKIASYGMRQALFSVQPSTKKPFVIDLIEFQPPIYFFR